MFQENSTTGCGSGHVTVPINDDRTHSVQSFRILLIILRERNDQAVSSIALEYRFHSFRGL